MKERLGFGDWLGVIANAGTGSLTILLGRLVQAAAVLVVLLALWPTVLSFLGWLKTGGWVVPTPMNLDPDLARRVAGSTDWVVVQNFLVWLAGHHVLWTALPLAGLFALAGIAIVRTGQTRRGRAGDVVSTSLRDEYLLQESWRRWRPRLFAGFALLLLAGLGAGVYLVYFSA